MKLRGPQAGGVVDVPDDVADRFLEAGYTKAEAEKKTAPAKPQKKQK